MRDCFSGIFFISIGMLLNLHFLFENLLASRWNLLLIVGINGAVVFVVYWWLYRSVRLSLLLALSLAQVGEFSFILAKAGQSYGIFSEVREQAFLATSILSMIATPLLIQWGHRAAFGLESMFSGGGEMAGLEESETLSADGHVIIIGYGLNGRNLARVLKEVGIVYEILEMDPDLVRRARDSGEPIRFGDGTRPEVLQRIGIDRARVLVVAISDVAATVRIVWQARSLKRDLYILVRTRYVAEIDRLYRIGADQVIPEEFETSVEIFARVLEGFHVPRNVITLQVDLIRQERYLMLRRLKLEGKSLDQLNRYLVGSTTDPVLLLDGSVAVGRTLAELEVRAKFGVTVIAIVRDGKSFHNPAPDYHLAAGDVLILLGSHQELDQAMRLLSPSRQED